MGVNKEDQLRDLLHQQAKVVSDEAHKNGGQVSPEQVKALRRLAQLVKICDTAQPSPFRKLWPILAVLMGTLIIVSSLFFVRVSETEIELDLVVSEISFSLPKPQVLTDAMALSTLGLSGMREIQLPSADSRTIDTLFSSEDTDFAIRLSVVSGKERQGTINLTALTLPADTRVSLFYSKVPHQYHLFINNANVDLHVDVNGPMQIGLSGTPVEQRNFASPKAILLRPGPNEIDMEFTLPGVSRDVFSLQLFVNNLSFFRIDEFVGTNSYTLVRPVSTILSGTLYFDSLNGEKYALRLGEGISFKRSEGEIRTLQLNDNHIALQFHGRVRGMSTGSSENRRNLMPTLFDWLRARQGLYLFWGTIVYFFSLIIGALRWWRTRE